MEEYDTLRALQGLRNLLTNAEVAGEKFTFFERLSGPLKSQEGTKLVHQRWRDQAECQPSHQAG